MPSTIIYTRVSSTDQGDSGLGLEVQRAKCGAFAALYELPVADVVVEVATTKTADPSIVQRPLLRAALANLRQGDGLLVYKLDRLSRDAAEWEMLLARYFGERGGRQLYSVCEKLDTSTAAGRMLLRIQVAVGQCERETIAERTKAALAVKIGRGERVGSVRYGYSVDDAGRLSECPAEQAVIRRARELRPTTTLRGIVEILREEGYRPRVGQSFHSATVGRMIGQQLAAT